MGLGLPLVKIVVEAHGGPVAAHSAGISRGSEFTIRLPLTARRPEEKPVTNHVQTDGKTMVIVEDNAGIRKMLAQSMKLKGFDVLTAADGSQGLATILDSRPDVALIDIGLPDVNGYELARLIRQKPAFKKMLLVAVTGYSRDSDRENALAAGFDLHLVKPLDLQELLEAIAGRMSLDEKTAAAAEDAPG